MTFDDDPERRAIDAVPTRGVIAIDPAEVVRQRIDKWPDFHPELFCHRCGRRNVWAWNATAEDWAKATEHLERGVLAILCPPCFAELYEMNTGERPVWELRRWRPDVDAPARTLGRNDFGRWDACDAPDDGDEVHLFALNHPPYRWNADARRYEEL